MQRGTNLNPVTAFLRALKTVAQNSAAGTFQTQRTKDSTWNKRAAAGAGEQERPLGSVKANGRGKAAGASLTHSEMDLLFFIPVASK